MRFCCEAPEMFVDYKTRLFNPHRCEQIMIEFYFQVNCSFFTDYSCFLTCCDESAV